MSKFKVGDVLEYVHGDSYPKDKGCIGILLTKMVHLENFYLTIGSTSYKEYSYNALKYDIWWGLEQRNIDTWFKIVK